MFFTFFTVRAVESIRTFADPSFITATGRESDGARVHTGLSDIRAWQWGHEWGPLQLSLCSGPVHHLFICSPCVWGQGGGQMRWLPRDANGLKS